MTVIVSSGVSGRPESRTVAGGISMRGGMIAGTRAGSVRRSSFIAVMALLLTLIPLSGHPAPVAAAGSSIEFPFASGATWYVSQGYNTSPSDGWSHYNCDASTLTDAISHTESCSASYQYKYSLDL